MFPITLLDALELQRGLDALPALQRDAIVTRARTQVSALEAAYPDLLSQPALDGWADGTIDEMVEHFADVPCPALAPDGTCGVYAFRPITCRTMGIPTRVRWYGARGLYRSDRCADHSSLTNLSNRSGPAGRARSRRLVHLGPRSAERREMNSSCHTGSYQIPSNSLDSNRNAMLM